MKKIFLSLFTLLLAIVPTTTLAAGFTFPYKQTDVVVGGTFDLNIRLDPQKVKIYTAKANLSFPATLLEVVAFRFATNWLPLTMNAYDVTDNKNGQLIKTAGYPKGIDQTTAFGTITFKVKSPGHGTITVAGDSFALDLNNRNLLTGSATALVVRATQPAGPAAPATPKPPVPTPPNKNVPAPVISPPTPPTNANQPPLAPPRPPLFDVTARPATAPASPWPAVLFIAAAALAVLAGIALARGRRRRKK